jgi:hypothetical protein
MFLLRRDGTPFLGDPSLELVPLPVNAGGRGLFSLLNPVDVSLLETLVVLKSLLSHGNHFLEVFPIQYACSEFLERVSIKHGGVGCHEWVILGFMILQPFRLGKRRLRVVKASPFTEVIVMILQEFLISKYHPQKLFITSTILSLVVKDRWGI